MVDSEKEQQQNQPTKIEEEQPPKEVIGTYFEFFTDSRMFYTLSCSKNADQPFCNLIKILKKERFKFQY